jgi:RHS repeat-associated protein
MIVPPGAAPNTATWTLNVASAGSYNVYARWTAHPNRATDAKYTVNHAGGATTVTTNQEANSGTWNLLGTYSFNAGNTTVTLTDQANGYVIADAVMLAPPGAQPNTATWTPNVAQAGTYEVYARWTASSNRATNATYTVTHGQGSTNVPVNQQANGGAWNLLGTFQLNPGSTHKVALTDLANGYVIADAIRLVPIQLQTSLTLYYVQPDHLNTPREVYDTNQQLRWKWDQQEPFGVTTPDENPASLGQFEMPLRFPGQYADKETFLNYNYFRTYNPVIGGYVRSDPIGLLGGLNTYAYVQGNPLGLTDWSGTQTPNPVLNFAMKQLLKKILGEYAQDPMDKGAQHEREQLKLQFWREYEMCLDACSGAECEVGDSMDVCAEDCRNRYFRRMNRMW